MTPTSEPCQPLGLALTDLLGRLEAHACMHDDLVMHDTEQAQWAADLRAAKAEIERLRAALLMAVRQNENDMLMTGDELRACREALEPNAEVTGLGRNRSSDD